MNIIHISAECYPIAKVGGLGDVVGALPKYQEKAGHSSRVILPFYLNRYTDAHNFETEFIGHIKMGGEKIPFSLVRSQDDKLEVDVLMVKIPDLLSTDYVYSFDDSNRFLAFSLAALTYIVEQETLPDVVNCHDHHTGLVPFMMSHCTAFAKLKETPSILTIHNAQYQGWFSHDKLHWLPEFPLQHVGLLDWDGQINPLACGIKCAWGVNSVSPGYMEEMMQQANGLDGLIRHERAKCRGILNGVDFDVWNPETDAYLPANFDAQSVPTGKWANKQWLCKEFQLDDQLPLFVFIGRLVYEKGADVLVEVLDHILSSHELSVIMLGSGDPQLETQLTALKDRFPGNYNTFIGYNEELSHRLYAGGDFLLMPSRVEPCGLNQMYAMRYGTFPIVRSVGGLKDTVIDLEDDGFGIRHAEVSVGDIAQAIERALDLWQNQEKVAKLIRRMMAIDNSWERSSEQYLKFYQSYIL